ncbi:MAG: hypothetical protein QME62_00150 [Armatimonadota bacterium]|nr:hypothetical protein [Armatimonadota bacterium]
MSDQEYPYTPPKPESKLSCLKIGAISCLVLVLVIIIGSYWLYRVIASNPAFKKGFEEVKAMATCTAQLQEIYRALERYNQKNGRYPSSLGELYPDYLENRKILFCPSDKSPSGQSSYVYYPPSPNAPSDTIILECRHHIIIEGQPPQVIKLRKDGRMERVGVQPSGTSPTSQTRRQTTQ